MTFREGFPAWNLQQKHALDNNLLYQLMILLQDPSARLEQCWQQSNNYT